MVKITQSLIGEGPEIAHIDLVIGPKGRAVESAFMTSLATPSIKNVSQAGLIFASAQASIAKAVMDSVEEGLILKEEAENLLIIVSVFVEWDAKDKDKVYKFNYEATKLAIKRAVSGKPTVEDALAKKNSAHHPFA